MVDVIDAMQVPRDVDMANPDKELRSVFDQYGVRSKGSSRRTIAFK